MTASTYFQVIAPVRLSWAFRARQPWAAWRPSRLRLPRPPRGHSQVLGLWALQLSVEEEQGASPQMRCISCASWHEVRAGSRAAAFLSESGFQGLGVPFEGLCSLIQCVGGMFCLLGFCRELRTQWFKEGMVLVSRVTG